MAQTNINIRMNEKLKQDFDTINTPNAETMAAIDDVNKRHNLRGPFNNVKELMEDLDAED